MKKWIKRILGVLALLVIVALVAITIFASRIVKTAVETGGPKVLGVPVTLGSAHVSLLRGRIILKDFEVGNPEKFKTPFLFQMGKLDIDVDMSSLKSGQILVKKIHILKPKIIYEKSLKTSNVGALLKNLEGDKKEDAKEEKKEIEDDNTNKKSVIIEEFLMDDGQISLSTTLALGQAIPIPLPAIHMTDIGKEEEDKGGMTIRDAITLLFKEIFKTATGAVTGSVKLIGKGVKAGGGMVVDAGGAVVDGAGAVGGAAVSGTKKAGKAVTDGAGKIVGGVGGLFKHDKKE